MTCIVKYPSKKAFREAVALDPDSVWIVDPSIVNPKAYYLTGMTEDIIFVTNHPKRSWFANVKRTKDGGFKVS